MLSLIGLGLDDQNDISLKALELIKRAHKVYLECYTSIINSTIEQMERLYQCTLILADRHLLENTDILVEESVQHDVVLLVPGTPLFATTHTDLLIRCLEKNVKHQVVNNTSIYNVIGHVGLYSYSFGRVVSVPFFSTGFKPLSVFERILSNIRNDLHTLCLLDIKIGKSYYEEHGSASNRFMSANTAMKQLLEYEETVKSNVITEQTKIFVICRFGCRDQSLHYDEIRNLLPVDFGRPLHSLIIPARMETIEEEHVNAFFNKKRMI
ncbi:diphthine synthase [Vavraia culicis subsp. floridensis]|uniref:diphthine methyl ester synthase n=1 Tax=Vavraia culicis (isolate floridensis) TaxID=948595 RepID=L2GS73_VAVCU|nr:diphthine synthase [Vavraia culicis subsp. floridensis]ELA46474.1 diphthine synthase [Vavraia culicis subsp. floridensis]